MHHHHLLLPCVFGGALLLACQAAAQLIIAGSPGYDWSTGDGLRGGGIRSFGSLVNDSGTAVAWSQKYVAGNPRGERAVRWDAGGVGSELGDIGLGSGDITYAQANAINRFGTAVGWSNKYLAGNQIGQRAVRWDGTGTTATELGHLGTSSSLETYALAYDVNDAGTAVGVADKYNAWGHPQGQRAVRWDASGTAATELESLGLSSSGNSIAFAINGSGTTVGWSDKNVAGSLLGTRAVRWEAGGTSVTELDHLGTSSSGHTSAVAYAVNDAGIIVGFARKYVSGSERGLRAVRWDAAGTAATELAVLATDSRGASSAAAYAVNEAGTAVGYSSEYLWGSYAGRRAVRWDASGTSATELGHLGLSSTGLRYADAFGVNIAGTAVGWSQKYVSGSYWGDRAVLWLPDASAVDLMELGMIPLEGSGNWHLLSANAISDDGWVVGTGRYVPPDGVIHVRHWVAQVGLGGEWTDAFSGSLDGTWGRGRQWSTGTPAMQVGDAVFNAAAHYTVTLDRDEFTRTVRVDLGTVDLDLAGHQIGTQSGLTIAGPATLRTAGTIAGDVINFGRLSGRHSPGTLLIQGDLDSSGAIEIRIAGPAPGEQHDHLSVSGTAHLDGTLAVQVVDGYVAIPGMSFQIMTYGALEGAFSQIISDTGLAGMWFEPQYGADALTLRATAIDGDANLDGAVTIADLGILAANWQSTDAGWWQGDFNYDGEVNIADLGILAANWQAGVSGGTSMSFEQAMVLFDAFSGVVVPEPASLSLLGLAGLLAMRRRRSACFG